MAKERLKSPRARLFVALDLPQAMRDEIEAWGERELRDPVLRRVPRDSLHITLAFLGWRPEKEIERIGEIVSGLESPAPLAELGDPAARPSLSRARLFALPVKSSGAIALQAELESELVAAHLYEPEKRPFWPHVTVARVKSEGKGSKRPRRVARHPEGLPKALLQPGRLVRVRLYRSELKPSGAEYIPLAQTELR
jgi:RNA 2',3'-cyclic 3'-phosphodiesterase